VNIRQYRGILSDLWTVLDNEKFCYIFKTMIFIIKRNLIQCVGKDMKGPNMVIPKMLYVRTLKNK
jgi:hypothetical protein